MKGWVFKFRCAFVGIAKGMQGQSSFLVHLVMAVSVIAAAAVTQCELWEWAILGICIGLVIALELMNSALESLAHGLCQEQNAKVGDGLDMASGAVLVASLTSAVIGVSILGRRLWQLLFGSL